MSENLSRKPIAQELSESERRDPKNWVDIYGDRLFRHAVSKLRDSSLAEDLVQETFHLRHKGELIDLRGAPRLRPGSLAY